MVPPPPPSNKRNDENARLGTPELAIQTPCAIVGMSCSFPGADNLRDFWKFLMEKGDGITVLPEDRWNGERWSSERRNKPGTMVTDKGGFIGDFDKFDYEFFGINKREAENMDPQQRLMLQLAWLAMEDGGYRMEDVRGRSIGVYLGNCFSDYRTMQIRNEEGINPYTITGTATSILANRVSYCFDLKGPSMVVDTACSSALLAMHLAIQSISMKETEMALIGGVQALLTPAISVSFTKLGATGLNGECRPFDSTADGYVRSEGAGICFIKTLDAAIRDKDRIYAVVKGSMSNQDGGLTPTLTTPSYDMQRQLIFDTYKYTGLISDKEHQKKDPIKNVQYVEAHGTGTPTGDPVELNSINDTFDNVVVGSVKGNVGHLEGASGIAGLVKAVLAVYEGLIPPTNRFNEMNPKIRDDNISVNKESINWPTTGNAGNDVRRASVNSFGFGGSNVHCILESFDAKNSIPAIAPVKDTKREKELRKAMKKAKGKGRTSSTASQESLADAMEQIDQATESKSILPLCITARSTYSLRKLAGRYANLLEGELAGHTYEDIVNVAFHNRTQFEKRLVILAKSKEDAVDELRKYERGEASERVVNGEALDANRSNNLCMVFCGQGAQWYAMARELLVDEDPVFDTFRQSMDECRILVQKYGNWDLFEHLSRSEGDETVNDTIYSQPATCAIQISLVDQWEKFGVRPAAVVGHSVGEVPAAYTAGAYSKEHAIRISVARGKHMDQAKGQGLMAAVGLSLDQAEEMLRPYKPRIVVSNINSPEMVTVSGDSEPMKEFVKEVEAKGVFCRLLRLKYSFHSHHMYPMAEPLVKDLEWLSPSPFRVPFYSVVTGKRLVDSIVNAKYIKDSMVSPVWFLNAMNNMWNEIKCNVILEVGPHPVLTGAMHQIHKKRDDKIKDLQFYESLRRKQPDVLTFMKSMARMFCSGYKVQFLPIIGKKKAELGNILDILPQYHFQDEERVWNEPNDTREHRLKSYSHATLGLRCIDSSVPCWRNTFNFAKFPWIQDHMAHGAVVVPAALFVSLSLAAARELNYKSLESFEVLNAMSCGEDDTLILETLLNPQTRTLTIRSQKEGAWLEHAKCTLVSKPFDENNNLNEDKLSEELLEELVPFDVDVFYAMVNRFGFTFGPSFRRLEDIQQGVSTVRTKYHAFGGAGQDDDHYDIHPITIDLMIQSAIALPPRIVHAKMPSFFRRIWAQETSEGYTPVHGEVTVYVKENYASGDSDLYMFNADKRLVMKASGFRCNELKNMEEKVPVSIDITKNSQAVFDLTWEEQPETSSACSSTDIKDIQTSRDGILRLRCGDSENTPTAEEKSVWNALESRGAEFLVAHADANTEYEDTLPQSLYVTPKTKPFIEYAGQFLKLSKALLKVKSGNLVIVTWNCLRDCRNVDGSAIIGFIRTLRNEQPLIRITIVDIDELTPRAVDVISNKLREPVPSLDDEICVRNPGSVWVPRWKLGSEDSTDSAERTPEELGGSESFESNLSLSIGKRGLLNTLHYESKDRRANLGPKEVEVRVKATAMNFRDVMVAMGMITEESTRHGYNKYTMGLEGAGEVSRIGSEVTNVAVGDAVFGILLEPYSKWAITQSLLVRRKPKHVSYAEAATIPVCFLTAYASLFDIADIQEGSTLLVHGAAGGVGIAATQLAKLRGAHIYGTASSEAKRGFAKETGCSKVFFSRDLSFYNDILRETAEVGVDCVINSFADEQLQRSLDLVAPFGHFIEIGKRDVYGNTPVGLRALGRNVTFRVYDLDQYNATPRTTEKVSRNLDKLVDLFEEYPDIIKPLPHKLFKGAQVEEAFRFMQQSRHIGKIVVSFEDDDISEIEHQLRAEANLSPRKAAMSAEKAYVITGGTSGIGLDVAEELLSRGAKHLLLLSRSGVDRNALARNSLARFALKFPGSKVVVEKVDISDMHSLKDSLTRTHERIAPIGGIIHAATVYRDVSIAEMNENDIVSSLRPKLVGGVNLHEITENWDTVDFFLSFSSISAAIGNVGQANYAAANYGNEALSSYRRTRGHVNSAVFNLGAVLEVGYLRDNAQISRMLQGSGFLPLTPNQVIEAMDLVLSRKSKVGQTLVSGIKYDSVCANLPSFKAERFSAMKNIEMKEQNTAGATMSSVIETIQSDDEKIAVLEAGITERIIKITGSDQEALPTDTPFAALGVDSLISTELRTWLIRETKCEISLFELTESLGVSHLARTILEKMN